MNEKKIIEVFNILQSNDISNSEKREKMKSHFNTNNFRDIINDYEKGISGINKAKIPHFTFIFYLSLVFMFLDDIDDIAEYIKERPSSKFLIISINIFFNLNLITLNIKLS